MSPASFLGDDPPPRGQPINPRGNYFHVGDIVRHMRINVVGPVRATALVYADGYTELRRPLQIIQFPGWGQDWFFANDFTLEPKVCPTCGRSVSRKGDEDA